MGKSHFSLGQSWSGLMDGVRTSWVDPLQLKVHVILLGIQDRFIEDSTWWQGDASCQHCHTHIHIYLLISKEHYKDTRHLNIKDSSDSGSERHFTVTTGRADFLINFL